MSVSISPTPSYREIAMALASNSPLVRNAALSARPPAPKDPQSVEIVLDAVRKSASAERGGVDITV